MRQLTSGGTVSVHFVLGTDGLAHDPIITKGLTEQINKLALDALAFWRLEPVREGARPVPAKMVTEFSFATSID